MLIVRMVMAFLFGSGALVGLAMTLFWGYCTVFALFKLGSDYEIVSLVTWSWSLMGAMWTYVFALYFVDAVRTIRHRLRLMRVDRCVRHQN